MNNTFKKNYYFVLHSSENNLYICSANNLACLRTTCVAKAKLKMKITDNKQLNTMKKVLNVAIAGKGFVIDEDAYAKLNNYLEKFKSSANMGYQAKELMDDIEERIAELFSQHITDYKNVVSIELVNLVISQLGMPDGSAFVEDDKKTAEPATPEIRPTRKFFRNPDGKTIGGVCTGLSTYFNIDVTIIRIIFIVCIIAGLAGFWIYIILWIIAPLATTAAQKCEMYGLPVTAENLKRFTTSKK